MFNAIAGCLKNNFRNDFLPSNHYGLVEKDAIECLERSDEKSFRFYDRSVDWRKLRGGKMMNIFDGILSISFLVVCFI